eukprot:NODE_11170_length_1303_cov_5.836735.p2 GENE.NODE_11170_length_1303_cov_5.836735~~NODE_11170_length_1303_cov_5.836735.p2  ORF type:complete len:307 (-),score=108.62 NODE_11170_length_1303_cov_5.836735:198-1118(-)
MDRDENEEASTANGDTAEAATPVECAPRSYASAAAAFAETDAARARAEALKLKGNERLKENTKSAARDALECFTQGVECNCADVVLNAQLHANRAHVRILLRQFVEAVDDCRKAIALDPRNVKAYWRAAKASLHLDLCRNAEDFCDQGLAQEPNDAALLKLRETCVAKRASLQQRRAEAVAKEGEFNADEVIALQEKVTNLGEQMQGLRANILVKQRDRQVAELTRTALEEQPEDVRLFSSVGRCFVRESSAELKERLNQQVMMIDEETPKLQKAFDSLNSRRTGSQNELQEMFMAYQAQQAVGKA